MKIGIDASRANNEKKTGVEWYAYFVIKQFMVQSSEFIKNKDIEFILYTDKPLTGELANLPDGWTEKVLRWPPRKRWTQIRLSWEMLWHAPDVLFIPAHVFPLIHPKKTVMTVHDIAAVKFPESYNWFERWYTLWSAKRAVKSLWKIIVPSEFTKSEIGSEFGVHSLDKIKVVHHGYDKRYERMEGTGLDLSIQNVLKKYSIKKPFLMSIGRLEEKKNTVRMIEVFNKIKSNPKFPISNFQFLLVGKPGHGYEKVEEVIENSKFKDDILTPGWVDNDDLPYLMNATEVFVFPSLYEGFGLPVLEAMACGTPVVASKGSSLEEVGGDVCVYVDALDVDDIARGIEQVIQSSEFKVQRIEKGLERVKDFSWEKCARETLEVLVSK